MSDVAGPSGLPNILAISIIMLGLIHLIGSIITKIRLGKSISENIKPVEIKRKNFRVYVLLLISFMYISLLPILGYLITTIIWLGGLMWLFGERRWLNISVISILFTVFLYLIFSKVLRVFLPVMSERLGI
jgi:hypothetical protein